MDVLGVMVMAAEQDQVVDVRCTAIGKIGVFFSDDGIEDPDAHYKAAVAAGAPKRARKMAELDKQTRTELEADVLRTLIGHLHKRSDVQNIDLMNLAGFCRNCLSKWYVAAAREKGLEISMDEARQQIYGMSYDEWKAKYQKETTPEQQEAFRKVMSDPGLTT